MQSLGQFVAKNSQQGGEKETVKCYEKRKIIAKTETEGKNISSKGT
jgi:hypothetical protein